MRFNPRNYQQVMTEATLIYQNYITMSLTEFRNLPYSYGKELQFTLGELKRIDKSQQEKKLKSR